MSLLRECNFPTGKAIRQPRKDCIIHGLQCVQERWGMGSQPSFFTVSSWALPRHGLLFRLRVVKQLVLGLQQERPSNSTASTHHWQPSCLLKHPSSHGCLCSGEQLERLFFFFWWDRVGWLDDQMALTAIFLEYSPHLPSQISRCELGFKHSVWQLLSFKC